MKRQSAFALLLLASCGGSPPTTGLPVQPVTTNDAGTTNSPADLSTPHHTDHDLGDGTGHDDGGSRPPNDASVATTNDAGSGSSALLNFAVFGDCRPSTQDDVSGYPTSIITGIFARIKALNPQFVAGTGDYMYATTTSSVSGQLALLLQAESQFSGPVYHAMGNHECTGYTDSNCPLGTESPNVLGYMSKLVPSGTTLPYYRIDRDTPNGKAKFIFVAENGWTTAENTWLTQQLADATTYTFIFRHEANNGHGTGAPGLDPSDTLLQNASYTLLLEGHSHYYQHVSTKDVISGNAGAPLDESGASYGFLSVQQLANGNISVTEIDEASGSSTDTWTITPTGTAAP